MKATVIISTWKRAGMLERTLHAVDDQTGVDFEIVVVSDGDDEATRELRDRISLEHDARWVFHHDQRGLAASRHTGANAALGDLFVFIDDDVVPGTGWLRNHVAAHEGATLPRIVTGSLTEEYPAEPHSRLEALLRRKRAAGFETFHRRNLGAGGSFAWFPHLGNNSSVSRATYGHVGGFDPEHVWSEQDLEAGERASRAGVQFVYEPGAAAVHFNPRTAESYENEATRKARADLYRVRTKRQLTDRTDLLKVLDRGPLHRRLKERFAWSQPKVAKKIGSSLCRIANATGSVRALDIGRGLNRSALYWESMRAAGETRESIARLAGSPVGALLFHAVGEIPRGEDRYYHISPGLFRDHLRWLSRLGIATLLPDEYLRGDTSPLSVMLTFDDGYEDFYTTAFPLLAELGLKATVFIVAGNIGGTSSWVQRSPAAHRKLLDLPKMLEMQNHGIRFGSHSLSHLHLTGVDARTLRREVVDSRSKLEDLLGTEVTSFAYPGGRVDERVRAEVGMAGYTSAFTTSEGRNDWNDPLLLRRISLSESDGRLAARIKMRTGRSPGAHLHRIASRTARAVTTVLPRSVGVKAADALRSVDATRRRVMWDRRQDRPLRVLHIVGTGRSGGVETYVHNLLTEISPQDATFEVCIVGDNGPMAEKLARAGAAISLLRSGSHPRIAEAAALARIVRRGKFDVIHSHVGGRLHLRAARLATGAPLVTHVHGFPSDWIPEVRGRTRELRRRIEALAGESSSIAASSPWLARILEESGYGGSVTILPYGVSLDAPDETRIDAMRASFGVSHENIVVGFVGRLVAHKGVRHVFDAATRLEDEPSIVFVIAGDGPLRNEVEQRARPHANIKFVGPHDAGAELMFGFDIALVPSDWEPFGIVSLEAMAASKPVVAFRVDGIPDVVLHGTTGLLVNHGDVVALGDAIRALADDPQLRKRLGTAGAARVAGQFTSRHAAQVLLEYYRESIAGPKRNNSRS
jgi:glycosyltransferase involved in cell wall biosynthesis/peptidoglycan/xylan/chitin deacetylase (PgdA/CDA1 family)/GT2 family glycosyltransferase